MLIADGFYLLGILQWSIHEEAESSFSLLQLFQEQTEAILSKNAYFHANVEKWTGGYIIIIIYYYIYIIYIFNIDNHMH